MTKEQILAAIAQAVGTGSVGDCDTGFITKIKELNNGNAVTFWAGTQAQYNAIETKDVNCLYIITDDTTGADIAKTCENAVAAATAAADAAGIAAANAVEAAEAAEEASVNAGTAKTIDFTGNVSLSWALEFGGKQLTELEFIPRRFEYNKTTGLVHYAFAMVYMGTMAKDEEMRVMNNGNNFGMWHAQALPVATSRSRFSAELVRFSGDINPTFLIRANEAFSVSGVADSCEFSGWYFSGETVG